MRAYRSALVAGFLACCSFAQTITIPGFGTPVSLTWLFNNKMRWAGAWSSTTTYNPQDVVSYGGLGYVSLSAGNLNNTPAVGAWWALLPSSGSGIPVPLTIALGGTNGTTPTRAATQLQVQRGETGSAARTYQAKFGDSIFAEDFGCLGDGATDDTACMTNALAAVAGNSKTLYACKQYKITGQLSVTSGNFTLDGCGTGIFYPSASSGSSLTAMLTIAGATNSVNTSVTADVNGNFAGRALNTTNQITVGSAVGIAAGGWLQLQFLGGGTRFFQQIVQVKSISGTTVTTAEPVLIPMDHTNASSVQGINPITDINIRGITIDGTFLTGGAAEWWAGILIERYALSNFKDITVQNFPTGSGTGNDAAAWEAFQGYGNTYANLRGINAGRHNGDFWWNFETNLIVSNVQGDNYLLSGTDSHGLDLENSTNSALSNLRLSGYTGRCMRMIGDAWSQLANVSVSNCGENGLFITWNTYQVQIANIFANLDTGTSALAIGGDDESYIWINGYSGNGNGSAAGAVWDIGLFSSTHHVFINGYQAGTPFPGGGENILGTSIYSAVPPNSFFNVANGSQTTANISCSGTATSNTTLYIATNPPGACTTTTQDMRVFMVSASGGVMRNLRVTAAHAGVNASSGQVTVVASGIANILTCTVGTGTSCTDLTDMFLLPAGTTIYVTVTTQAAEVLAGLNISFEY